MKPWLLLAYLCYLLPAQAVDLIVVDQRNAQLRRIDTQNPQTRRTTELSGNPVALWQDREQVYVLDGENHSLITYDPSTLQKKQSITLALNPVAIVGDLQFLWILHGQSLKLSQLNRADLTVVRTIALGKANPFLLAPALALDGNTLWVTNPLLGQLLRFERQTLKPLPTLTLGKGTYLMPMAARDGQVYVALGEILYHIDGSTGQILGQTSLREKDFSERLVTISQLFVNENRVFAIEPTSSQVFSFDRQTLVPFPPVKFSQTISQASQDATGHLVLAAPERGEVMILANQTPVTFRVGGSPSFVLHLVP